MLDKRWYPWNPDGSIKHKQPCQNEGCNWPNWHLCPKTMGPDRFPEIMRRGALTGVGRGTKAGGRMSEDQRARIAESQRQRHAEKQRENLPRDLRIQEEFAAGATKKELKTKYRLTHYSLNRALSNSRSACLL